MTVLNDMLYLNGNYGGVSSLWQSDGTNIGTSIVPGSENTEVFDYEPQFPVVKNILYFSVQNGTLYKYNPKDSSGIVYVTQVNPDVASPGIQNLFSLNDSLFFFTAYDNLFNQQLWCSDGTALGTVLLKSTTRAYNSLFLNFYAIKKILYFSCYASGTGYELYTTDGSVSGTKMVKDINPGIYSSYPSFFTQTDSALIFNATDGVTGNELWRTDGTANGTALLKDINQATTASSSPALVYPGIEYLPLNNGQLFFGAFNDLYGDELWKTDGTPDGTFLTKDIIPGLFSGFDGVFSGLFTSYKDNYYYFGETLNDSVPLLKTDGTSAGTTLVQNFVGSTQLVGGSIPPWPSYMAATDSLLYIGFVDNELFAQLWVSDGQSTAKLINQNITYVSPGSGSLYALGVMVFFINGDNNNGIELWKSDGTYDGTKLVKDINPGPGNSYPTNMLVYNNKLYFTAFDGSNNYLWASDGTEAGTLVIEQVQISTSTPFTISGGKLYFTANTDTTGTELWVTDGTKAGTYQVKDVNPGTNSSNISNMVDVNGTLFFTADDGVHGNEIWKTDGTDSGTVLVKDITPGIGSTYPDYMVNYNGRLYCIINDTIWQSNGSAAGTLPVTDVSLNGLSNIQGLAVSGNNLYFSAYTYQYGNELYVGQINSTLPVTLLSFTGQWDKKDAVVNWQTTNEINNKYFNVQRSLTGSGFTNVGQIKADASLSQTHDYSFTDVNAASLGSNSVFYRLQQVDFDGHFTYSNIVRLPITGNGLITITPNPAQKTAYITSSADIAGATIIITDMGGRVISILKQNLSAASPAAINISGLASGVYNITVQGNNQVKLQSKLVVQ
jgi:ELWxxDGT repeat protein